ncbi:MAG TPA: c-type cytochrome [Polyangia bacterium]|nr:c-type cytochrome [Polyangia bacterium]
MKRPLLLAAVAALAACSRPVVLPGAPPPFTAPVTLGGRVIEPAALEHGRVVFTHFCRACHGDAGDGKGTAAAGLSPPPRDLRLGIYKFAAVAAGQLPNDADLARTIRQGLHGTAMLAWEVPAAELDDLIQYVKAFSPRWRNDTPGEVLIASADPWTGRQADALARGTRVYHGLAQCAVACHPAYATRAEIYAFTKELTGNEVREFRPDLYQPVPKDSDYGFKIVPPDFTFNDLRGGDRLADIYRAIAAGIGGTAMPTWKGVLPETDLWAMAHYVASLAALRDTPGSRALAERLRDQPPWTPPPPPDAGSDAAP